MFGGTLRSDRSRSRFALTARKLARLVLLGCGGVLVLAAGPALADDDSRESRRRDGRADAASQRRLALAPCPSPAHEAAREDDDDDAREDDDDGARDERGDRRRRRVPGCEPGASSGVAKGDFNGDGFADLAIGVPGEETPAGVRASGAVNVIYGSAAGLTATDASVPAAQFWSQNAGGVPGLSEEGDGFGAALAAGEFNGDDFSDLAIGAPFQDSPLSTDAGKVVVLYGSRGGLTTSDPGAPAPQTFNIESFFPGLPFSREEFGRALAWGDFDADGVGDLAIGSPGFGSHRTCAGATCVCNEDPDCFGAAGAVFVLFGVEGRGLSISSGQFFELDDPGIPDGGTSGDRFGAALAGGDFDGDRATDLAIGVPFWDIPRAALSGGGSRDAGAVVVLFGRAGSGLATADSRLFDECMTGNFPPSCAQTVSQPNAQFGTTLAAGDFDGNGEDDLAMGAPFRTITLGSPKAQAGGVRILHGPRETPTGAKDFLHQDRIFPGASAVNERDGDGSPTEPDDQFGSALAAGDFDGDGRKDLAIGVQREDVLVQRTVDRFETVINAGAVNVVYGSDAGLSIEGRPAQFWTQQSINIEDDAEAGDLFGVSLTAWDFGANDGTRPVADLAIGVPREDVGRVFDAGAVNVLYGSSGRGLTFTGDQLWTQRSPGVPGGAEANDHFGEALY